MIKNKKIKILIMALLMATLVSGCGVKWLFFKPTVYKDENFSVNSAGEIEMTEEQMYKLLEESGYGEGIDWANQSDDDPNIPKSMDITSSREKIAEAYYKAYSKAKEYEPGDMYEKAWWDYIPDSYDLSGDIFPATKNYAGQEKYYNNSLEQTVVYGEYTTGQSSDLSNVEYVAKSFLYEEMRNKYRWTDDLDALCKIADSLNVADFYVKISDRPYIDGGGDLIEPAFMTAYYETSTVGYDTIGIPQMGGYKFSITVWAQKDKPVGWVNELEGGKFINENEVYENMGEWDFYDNLEATSSPKKVEKPKVPNGVLINKGQKANLSKEQYVYDKVGTNSGTIYYYGNGITVDMTFFGGTQGGKFEDALEYCRIICHNK